MSQEEEESEEEAGGAYDEVRIEPISQSRPRETQSKHFRLTSIQSQGNPVLNKKKRPRKIKVKIVSEQLSAFEEATALAHLRPLNLIATLTLTLTLALTLSRYYFRQKESAVENLNVGYEGIRALNLKMKFFSRFGTKGEP